MRRSSCCFVFLSKLIVVSDLGYDFTLEKKIRKRVLVVRNPSHQGNKRYTFPPLTSPSLLIHNNVFDVKKNTSKVYYSLLVTEKAQPPNVIRKWKIDFNLSDDHLREAFLLPHSVTL